MSSVSKESLDLSYALVDLLQGDSDVYRDVLASVDMKKIRSALDFIINNNALSNSQKVDLITNSWRLYYRIRPPTPEEFLTPQYLGRMGDPGEIYPHVRQWFLDFFDSTKPYRNAVLYTFIGSGKSTLSVLINLYILTHISLMRDPKKYFGQAPSSVLAVVLCSYSLKKSSELLLEPFLNVLECSEFFKKVRTKEDMIKAEMEYQSAETIEGIYWTTATTQGTSALQFSNSANVKLVSSVHNLLGLTIVAGTMTEIAFFREAGKSDEYVMRFFNDLKGRIESRMKGNYFGRSILDSSPNDLESPIDKYASFEARRDKTNFVVSGSRWQWCPDQFADAKSTFPVFKGGSGKPPQVLVSAEGYDAEDVVWVPDTGRMKQLFIDDTRKALKDQAGIPSGNLDKLIYESDRIEECFVPQLRNIYTCIKADAKDPPQHLIWDQIKNDLFVKVNGKYRFYYKPTLIRTFSIDQSISGDMAGIAVSHVERKYDSFEEKSLKDLIYVVDFVVPIHPFGGRINLDAIRDFIVDLLVEGHLSLKYGSFDSYQSETNIQSLARFGVEMENLSVDKTVDPYMFLIQQIQLGNLKVGKNIFLKNNIKSLRMTRRRDTGTFKVDHTLGDVLQPQGADTNWATSFLGFNAKDVSDAVCGSVQLAKKYLALDPLGLSAKWDEDRILLSPEQIQKDTDRLLKDIGFAR